MVKNGQIQRKKLARERLDEAELLSELRMMGVEDVKEPSSQPVSKKDKRLFR